MNVALHPDPAVLGPIHTISLCTGGGGLDLGVELAIPSARAVVLVEREAPAVATLVAAMEAGLLAPAPVWSDVRTLPGRRYRGLVDGVVGGIPCQPHSVAGKRLGRDDPRDLWGAARRIVVQSGAWWVLIENVPGMLTSGGAERVWRDLGRLGFEREIGLFSAAEVGASHERQRLFILGVADRARLGLAQCAASVGVRGIDLGDADRFGKLEQNDEDGADARQVAWPRAGGSGVLLGDANGQGQPQPVRHLAEGRGWTGDPGDRPLSPPGPRDDDGWADLLARRPDLAPATEPLVRRVVDGLAGGLDLARARDIDAFRTDALRLLGNGVYSLAAAHALRTLASRLAGRSAGAALLVRMMGV